MSLSSSIYNGLFKRTSTFALACIVSAFVFERTFELTCNTIFERVNKGKLYKDIQPQSTE